ncbi:hypothetical protein N3K66_000526 [Trichothecium roseum]|uniref:Uncharacterized protein n=1 Tax=Trichothecium roseum TaxID=47278 RepID=A0ACC0VDN3_9HYPO|nr:hypothetical protein N3K66_000526 [Trichothecium roseum]
MKPSVLFKSTLFASWAYAQETVEFPTLPLSQDESFNFELLIPLGATTTGGGDVADLLGAAKNIKAGDMKSHHMTMYALANKTKARASDTRLAYDVSNVQNDWFSAAQYFRRADFYLHGNWDNPLIYSLWEEQIAAFDKATAALPVPPTRVQIPADNFTVEAIWYSAPGFENARRPTLAIANGYDASQEDSYHAYVAPALARGWHCITFEGPGQSTVRRRQSIGFIPDWERVVTPVIDYILVNQTDKVDPDRMVLLGNSMGGYLAARAAAFEPRLSALILNGGVWELFAAFSNQLPRQLLHVFNSGDRAGFDKQVFSLLESANVSTTVKWGFEHGLFSFYTKSPFDLLTMTKKFSLKDVADNIKMPVWIADAQFESFFKGQSEMVRDALGDNATLHLFNGTAGYHCQPAATQERSAYMFAWLNETLRGR